MCIHCGSRAPLAGNRCTACGRTLDAADPAATVIADPPTQATTPAEAATELHTRAGAAAPPGGFTGISPRGFDTLLGTGQPFAGRYTLIRMLGVGGMGAVYQAWDQELGVVVALKIIRPEVMQDPAAAADLERRFKRELLLARAVTHKNVVRIHDLGDVDGIKYITMPYVHGADLATELRRNGKLAVRRALRVAREVAAGLVAAHQAGVVHRDLKPANIMLDSDDHALIMDFGIARSTTDTAGATKGVVTGTLGYMAPEQARGVLVDHRADIYSFGLILSDMLVGRRPAAESEGAFADLMSRMQQAPAPLRSIDPTLPESVERIVSACVQPDANLRYQKTEDLAADLEHLDQDGRPVVAGGHTRTMTATAIAVPRPRRFTVRTGWIAGAAALAMVSAATMFGWKYLATSSETPATVESVSLAILPFRNASGDGSLNWLGPNIPETLRTEIGQSSQLRTVPPDRLHQLLKDLRIDSDSTFDTQSLSRVAEFTSADLVLWGQYLKFGNEIRIDATLQDIKRQRSIPLKAQANGESGLLGALDQLAQSVRDNLALSRQTVAELRATAVKPSSTSIQALRQYSEGVQFSRQGKYLDARNSYAAAVHEDPGFALAYAKLASTAAGLGETDAATNFARTAVSLSDRLPPQEKLLIAATQARILNKIPEAIESYERLAGSLSDSDDVRLALGGLYESVGAFPKAKEQYAALVSRDPKYLEALLALGRIETRLGNAQGGLEHLNHAMQLAVQLDNTQAKSDVLRSLGSAYRALNKADDAIGQYQQSLEIERRLNRTSGIADALFGIAATQAGAGRLDEALKGYNESLTLRREIGDASGIAAALAGLGWLHDQRGQYDDALTNYREALQGYRQTGNKSAEALMLNNIGNLYLSRGELEDARTYFEGALTLNESMKAPVDTARTLHNLGIAAANGGDYDTAMKHYVRALSLRREGGDRRGTAVESYSLGVLFEYQAQFGKALDAHAEAVTILRDIRETGLWLAAILGQQGSALSQAGRFADADKSLNEALQVAQKLRNQALIAQIMGFQGDNFFYQGDVPHARTAYEAAQQALGTAKDRKITLPLKVGLARLGVTDKPAPAAIAVLRQLVNDADATGYKHLAVECSVNLGDALMRSGNVAAARQELERALSRSERFGLRMHAARSHRLLGALNERAGNHADARRHLDEARQLLDAIRKDARTDDVLKRADLR